MKDITLHTVEQLGMAIRLKRKEKGLTQTALAELLQVNRKWVLRLEQGNPGAEIGLVLRAMKALGLSASLSDRNRPKTSRERSRLDEVFDRLQKPRK